MTWSEGSGRSLRYISGTTTGAESTTLARAGAFDGSEKNMVWLSSKNKLYFTRDDALMSYSPETNQVVTERSTGVWLIGRAPMSGLFIVNWDFEVIYGPVLLMKIICAAIRNLYQFYIVDNELKNNFLLQNFFSW